MNRTIAALALFTLTLAPVAAQPRVSERQEVAIFAMGHYGWNIPREALGTIDLEIQKVFLDLGRFTVIGYAQRFSTTDVQAFTDALKKAREAGFVLPQRFQFGEAFLTAAEFERLLGSFQVAIPVVVSFDSRFDNRDNRWETDIRTSISFLDAGTGTLTGVADVQTSGTDRGSQLASIRAAIGAIPMELQYRIRSIAAFTLSTRVLAVDGREIRLQMGSEMGIRKGDEYSVIVESRVAGFRDEREEGLVLIKDVGPEVSTGLVLFSSTPLGPDTQLREIPRRGVDAAPYLRLARGSLLRVIGDPVDPEPEEEGTNIILGLRMPLSRGFFDVRPYAAIQVPVNGIRTILSFVFVPVNVLVGVEYNIHLGRLAITPHAGIGTSFIFISEVFTGETYDTSDMFFPHLGGQAYLSVSYLFNRDTRLFLEAGLEYWLSLTPLYSDYGGVSFGGGLSFKL
ncbi:MAG TPA: hypothetical protein VLH39_02950 [Magnetospirillaceae bacterium]|nr:hypothetical protein [Magnetospirillaceae bacterium]